MTPESTPQDQLPTAQAPRRRRADQEPVNGWFPTIAIGLGVACLDWVSKLLVATLAPDDRLVEVVPGSVGIWHVRNQAMILGLYGDLPLGIRKLIAVAAALVGVALMGEVLACGHRLPAHHRPWTWLFVGMFMGGMLGNLGERAVHWGVTDFISVAWGGTWLPPGNFADLALFASVPLAMVVSGLELLARSGRSTGTVPAAEVMGD
jgi:lipoprotein signal peptidase